MSWISYFLKTVLETIQPKSIPSLDGIRAISCLFVIIGHFSYLYSYYLIEMLGPIWGATVTFCIGNQYTGVTFFFVLSGFLITNLLIEEMKTNQTIDIKGFLIKRAFRIFPAYYFYLIVISIFLLISKIIPFTKYDWVAAFTYTYNYLSDLNPWFFGHFWSLAIEEHFYLIWPLFILLTYKKFGKNFPLFLIFTYPFIRVICYFLFPEMRNRMSIMSHTRFDSLLFGCSLAYYYKAEYFPYFNNLILKYYLHFISFFHILLLSRLLQQTFEGRYTMTIGYSLDCLAMSIVLVYVVQNQNWLTKLLNLPVMVHLGTISYSLYLWHIPFTWEKLGTKYLLLRFFAIYICALASYLIIEIPFLRLRRIYIKTDSVAKIENPIIIEQSVITQKH